MSSNERLGGAIMARGCAGRSLVLCLVIAGSVSSQIIINHDCTWLDQIPDSWILEVRTLDSHYAHTSHGGQLTYGLEFIEADDAFYNCEVGYCVLPDVSGAWCVFDGQETEGYITPDLYWQTDAGMDMTRAVLEDNPGICTSMWSWCTQCDYYSEAEVDAYLDSMSVLESEFPGVAFIYFTGNAQQTGSTGYNRWLRNSQIRDFCVANDKILFDFEDLDSWWYNPSTSQWEHQTYSWEGQSIPSEHPQFYGDEYGHTTAESCEQKGRAVWWMMARIAGWGGTGIEDGAEPALPYCSAANPSSGPLTIHCVIPEGIAASLTVYGCDGRSVYAGEGALWGTTDVAVDGLPSGVYVAVLRAGASSDSARLVLLR
jgi:hypothetical protein